MRPPAPFQLSRSLLQLNISRSYATRLPRRPPYRAPDPFESTPDEARQDLTEDVTFIHNSPPSAPTPLSFTTAPSSPLLREASPEAERLPPPMRQGKPEPPRVDRETLLKIRELRRQDPETWTRSALAKAFNVTTGFVFRTAALRPKDRKKKLEERDAEHEEMRSRWGEKKSMVKQIRQKRREYW
ncbi:hypothetical protein CERSUDRAFT_151100 [Gelatoporia subvermispora B]|uniref:Uncharacterized protein n=1 Tax=Ceriporiopsis subvermispora (strain B) TaxID=914234 RepID=M2RNV7_CERS8|nr:hypothetical protein CERSUDRAFT_151100 [Gelatoporia subvermispora B]